MSDDVELELKFELTRDAYDRLVASIELGEHRVDPPVVSNIASTYFDTPGAELRKAGFTLRVREAGGVREQTLKSSAGVWSGLASRRELTSPLDGAEPDLARFRDGAMLREVGDLLAGKELAPQVSVEVRRVTRMVEAADGSRIEIALDGGAIRAGDRSEPLYEAEFELKAGDVGALFPVARAALASLPVRPSATSKSERGFRLIEGAAAYAPRKAGDVPLASDATVEEALEAVLRSCLAQILANLEAVRAGDDTEGPHQLRVGLRRLRSALKVFRQVLDRETLRRIGEGARDLGRAVGEVRDIDVLADETIASCAGHVDVADLLALVDRERTRRREALRAHLDDPATGAFVIDLLAFVEARQWRAAGDRSQAKALASPARPFARAAVERRWAKSAKKGRSADRLTPEERHALRKSLKTLRYAISFFAPLLPGHGQKAMSKRVKKALDVLGYVNDVRSAEGVLDIVGGSKMRSAESRARIERAAGFCIGWHRRGAAIAWDEHGKSVSLGKHVPD